jgi:peroxiredoxin
MKRMPRTVTLAFALLLAALSYCPGAELVPGNPAPDFELKDTTGKSLRLSSLRGEVVVLHFWATWCPYCLEEMEALETLFGQHRGRGFAPVSVNVGETSAAIGEAMRSRRVSYPILLDAESAAAKLYGVTGIPTSFILDRNGTVRFKILGKVEVKSLRRMVEGLL